MSETAPPRCQRGHPMRPAGTWKFDHQPGDDPRATAQLNRFAAMGFELGGDMVAWACDECGEMVVDFVDPEEGR